MAAFAPFESAPRIAVALSGGPDSLALTHLADRWARQSGGTILALTVDHGVRTDSAEEACRVGDWMTEAGISHQVLRPRESAPSANIQDWARDVRYRLLSDACREHGILHLLTAHHRGDQAETLLVRLGRGSGLDGLAAMAPIVELADCRLLRPLLPVTKSALTGWLKSHGLEWVDDPSNRSPGFARARVRARADDLSDLGLTTERMAETAERLASDRAVLEQIVGRWLARHVRVDPAGFVDADHGAFLSLAPALARRALFAMLATVGGSVYPPRRERLARLLKAILDGPGAATLGGCQVIWDSDRLLVVREPAAADHAVSLMAEDAGLWDGRFRYRTGAGAARALTGTILRRLGPGGWRQIAENVDGARALTIPKAARATLPAIFRSETVIAVPALGYGPGRHGADILEGIEMVFRPVRALAPPSFAIADWPESPM